MSSPLIYILLPGLVAAIAWFLRGFGRISAILVLVCCALLALFAWQVEIGRATNLGPLAFEINPNLAVLGRNFFLPDSQRSLLVLIYGLGAFWVAGARVARVRKSFPAGGLAIITLLVAALSVQPFLFAALFIELAVLLSIPMLTVPGSQPGKGILRFLIFQTLALPFILIAGWATAGAELNPADKELQILALASLAIGFALFLGVFPFYTWIPMLAKDADSFVAGFVLSILPLFVVILGLNYLNSFAWLRLAEGWQGTMILVGTIMVLTGGIWAIFQQNIARLMGYAVIVENGFALLAIGSGDAYSLELWAQSLLPRLAALALLALTLAIIRKNRFTFDLANLHGIFYRLPLTAPSLVLALFSLGGMPLLAGFPIRQALLEKLAADSLPLAIWLFIASAGLIIGGIRALLVMAGGAKQPWQVSENRLQSLLLIGGMLLLVGMGILPQFILPLQLGVLDSFSRLYLP